MHYLGVDVGGTGIKTGVVSEDGTIIAKKRIPTKGLTGYREIVEAMAKLSGSDQVEGIDFSYELYEFDDGTRYYTISIVYPYSIEGDRYESVIKAQMFNRVKVEALAVLKDILGDTDIVPYVLALNYDGSVYRDYEGW